MKLSSEQLRCYREQGVVYPIKAFEPEDARALIPEFEAFDARLRGMWDLPQYPKLNVISRWVHRLVSHPPLLDAVESLIGPDILCWGSTFFAKKPRDPHYVGWHQDVTYWGLEPVEGVLTAWLGLTESTPENGCMQVVPGTHRLAQLEHTKRIDTDNLLQSGQEAVFEHDPADVTDVVLKPGEFSLHHSRLLHGSQGNPSDRPRIGLSINYISAEVRQIDGWDCCSLMRGNDGGHFELEPPPAADFDEAAIAAYHRALEAPSGLGRAAKR